MCKSCSSYGLNRREFIGKTIKASGGISLALAGGIPSMGSELFTNENQLLSFSGSLL